MEENKHYLITYLIEVPGFRNDPVVGCAHFVDKDSHDARWVESFLINPNANRGGLINLLLSLEYHTNKKRSIYMKADKVFAFRDIGLSGITDEEARKHGYIQ